MSLPFFMGAQKSYLLIDNNRITTGGKQPQATRDIGYTRIYLVSGRPLAFVASLDVIQRQGAIRDKNVLTWREDSDAVICLHRKHPKKQGAYHAGQLTKEETR